jgi:uncharacterized membrane protein YhhN
MGGLCVDSPASPFHHRNGELRARHCREWLAHPQQVNLSFEPIWAKTNFTSAIKHAMGRCSFVSFQATGESCAKGFPVKIDLHVLRGTCMAVPSSRPSRATIWISTLIFLAAAMAMVGAIFTHGGADMWRWLHWTCKPLATFLIGLLAWRTVHPVSAVYRRDILIGIALCLVGDVLLMVPRDLFVPGLVSFLLAHGLFIAAFSNDVRVAVRWWPWLLCLVYGAVMTALLWRGIATALRIPVLVYVAVLTGMGGQALGRAICLRKKDDPRGYSARYAAAGAILFMLSDSLLAWDRFHTALPLAGLYILATYYAALWLIARSVDAGTTVLRGKQD